MAVSTSSEVQQYLTFKLSDELFAIEIDKVREVLEYSSVTKVPRTPEFMRGVINLRGSVVPVIDLRLKFDMSKTEKTINTCIVIVEVELDGETTVLGALADAVQEVFDMDSAQIEPPPKIGSRLKTDFLKGMGKHKEGEQFIMLLDIDKVFSTDELSFISSHSENQE